MRVNSFIHSPNCQQLQVLLKLESKFKLDLDDEAAVQHFQSLINESASALFEQIKENAHRIAQYWRR